MKTIGLCLFVFALVVTIVAAQRPSQPARDGCRRGQYKFRGRVTKGHSFSHKFDGFTFSLVPIEYGWSIDILQGDQHDLASMTGPSHGPNAIYIEGWHFRNAANTGPNSGGVNQPQERRAFLFSPRWPHCKEAEGLDKDGEGTLEITDMKLGNLKPGEKAAIVQLDFTVKLKVGQSACAACPSAQ